MRIQPKLFPTLPAAAARAAAVEPSPGEEPQTDEVRLNKPSAPSVEQLVWPSLEIAGLLSARAVSGPLGAALNEAQKQGLLTALKEIEEGGGQFYTGRLSKPTPRAAEYVMKKVLEKNKAQLKSSLWVGNSPLNQENPDKIESLVDLQIAQSIYGVHPENGVEDAAGIQIVRNLDEAGFVFREQPRNGHEPKEIGPVKAYRYLRGGRRRSSALVVHRAGENRYGCRHSIRDLQELGELDFFMASGELASVGGDQRAQGLKDLAEMGLEVAEADDEGTALEAYQALKSGKSLELRLHGDVLETIDSDASGDTLAALAEKHRDRAAVAHEALAPLQNLAKPFEQSFYFQVMKDPVAGMSAGEQGQLLARLVEAAPETEELPGEGRLRGDPLAAVIYGDLRKLADTPEQLGKMVDVSVKTLKALKSGKGHAATRFERLMNDHDNATVGVRGTVLTELLEGNPSENLDSLLGMHQAGERLDDSIDQYLALRAGGGDLGAWSTLLDQARQSNSELNEGSMGALALMLEPLEGTEMNERIEAALALEEDAGEFASEGPREALYRGLRAQAAEVGLEAASAGLASRRQGIRENLEFSDRWGREGEMTSAAELFFHRLPANGEFDTLLSAVKAVDAEVSLREALGFFLELPAESLARAGEVGEAFTGLSSVMDPKKALEELKELEEVSEPGLGTAEKAALLAGVRRHIGPRNGAVIATLFEKTEKLLPDPADRKTLRAVTPGLAAVSRNGLDLANLVEGLATSVPMADLKPATDFMKSLQSSTEDHLPTSFLARSLALVAARLKPEQSFTEAAEPLGRVLPLLADKMEVAETITSEVPPDEFEAALAVVGRLNVASERKLKSSAMSSALKLLLNHRQDVPLQEQARPLIKLTRLLVDQPDEVVQTFEVLQERARSSDTTVPEEFEVFEDLFINTFDARSTREVLELSSSLTHDQTSIDIELEENMILFDSFAVARN